MVALGAWADVVTGPLGYRLPLGVKRGYHMHYRPAGNAVLNHTVLDAETGYAMAPMARGIRLTTGAEFADRDAPKTPVQLARAEPVARTLFPLGERLDPEPWMGVRPCTPDMLPVIGPAPRHGGLWFAFGHAHHGLTLGPVTGRLLAEMMTGEKPFIDPTPYRADQTSRLLARRLLRAILRRSRGTAARRSSPRSPPRRASRACRARSRAPSGPRVRFRSCGRSGTSTPRDGPGAR